MGDWYEIKLNTCQANGFYNWEIYEYFEAPHFYSQRRIAFGNEKTLEEASAAAIKRYKEIEGNE